MWLAFSRYILFKMKRCGFLLSLQTMSHAAYVYDIDHVIVDNLQFMTSYLRFVRVLKY